MNHVIVQREVSIALGQTFRGNRLAIVLIENRLYDSLENHSQRWQNRRDPEDDSLFEYPLYYCDGDNWFTFHFSVNDRAASGYLFVEALSVHVGKNRI